MRSRYFVILSHKDFEPFGRMAELENVLNPLSDCIKFLEDDESRIFMMILLKL